ncbi:hypothetical protein R3P38DRAFT_2677057 [Favolaschia claudopus]|uniref:Thioredoxin domain-containing protein n=1 Tax=Favolaschia claudopus TaxID=2862362 RepID=A0AAW0E7I7_9AGAR
MYSFPRRALLTGRASLSLRLHARQTLCRRSCLTYLETRRSYSDKPPTSNASSIRDRNAVGVFTPKSAAVFILTGIGLLFYFRHEKAKVLEQQEQERASKAYGRPSVGGPFSLTTHTGEPYTEQNLLGKWSMVYFGFTNCPDICPAELDKMGLVLEAAEKEHGKIFNPVFVSVDPARDSPSRIAVYLKDFHPAFTGIVGSYQSVKAMCKAYRVYFSTPPNAKPEDDYLVDHSIFVYFMDPKGQFLEAFGQTVTVEEMLEKIRGEIAEILSLTVMSAPSSPQQPPKPQPARLPSLNQLAARININATNGAAPAPAASSGSASRPRLSAFALRTTSNPNASNTSLVSTNDSIAVNAPSTRSTSPSALSSSPRSGTPSNEVVASGGDPNLTAEKLEKLNQETTPVLPEKKTKVGYKNIPSLDAITARMQERTRGLSIDGTLKPPEPEMIEDPKTPGIPMKAPEHPLEFNWTIYHDTKAKVPFTPASAVGFQPTPPSSAQDGFPQAPESTDYEAGLTVVGEFSTVEEFCRYFNWLKPPSNLERNSNYHLFKSGIKPMWEDEANANGGKWVLTMKNNPALLDRCWSWLAMALVGEELEEGQDLICGAVVSLRSKVDRIQVWTRSKDDVEKLNGIGKKLVKLLDVSEADGIGLEFQYNSDDRPLPNKFLSIQAMPVTSYRPTFQPNGPGRLPGGHGRTESMGAGASPYTPVEQTVPSSAGPGGAFANFGIGNIGGTSAWRAKRQG